MKKLSLALISVVASAAPLLANIDNDIHRTFQVAAGGQLVVSADVGDIEVTAGNGSAVTVDVRRTAKTSSQSKADKIFAEYPTSVTQSGNTVTVKVDHENDGWFHLDFGNDIRIKTVVSVPKNFNLRLDTSGGDVSISDVSGNINTHTSGGDISATRVDGPLNVDTSGGDITIRQSGGAVVAKTSGGDVTVIDARSSVDARTSGGDIEINGARGVIAKTSGGSVKLENIAGGVDAHTSGGDVVARFAAAPTADVSLTTSGGQVKVFVPASAGFELDASSSGGDVDSEIPVLVRGSRERDSLIGRVNNGGPHMRLRSSAGDIAIVRSH